MKRKACRIPGNRLIKGLVGLMIVLGTLSTYLTWNRWSYVSLWNPKLQGLISEVDDFFWSLLKANELSWRSAGSNLSETFVRDPESLERSRTGLRHQQGDTTKKHYRNLSKVEAIDELDDEEEEPDLPLCPQKPPKLKGWLDLPDFYNNEPPTLKQLSAKYQNLP